VRTFSPYKDYSSLLRWQTKCVYILQLRNCVNDGMFWFLECSSYFLFGDLILLFVTLIELLGTVYASFLFMDIILLFMITCRNLLVKSPLGDD
jgi:hypothetical protein